MSEEYTIADSKQTDFDVGVDAQAEYPLRPDSPCPVLVSPQEFVMGGISRAGSRQLGSFGMVARSLAFL